MPDKIKPGKEHEAEAIRKFFKRVQNAKTDIGISIPGGDIAGISAAMDGLALLEDGCRAAYADLLVKS